MRLPNSGQNQKLRVREGQRRREEASSREKAAPSPGSAETRWQRRIQTALSPTVPAVLTLSHAAPSPHSAESRRHRLVKVLQTQCRDQAAEQNPGGAESQRC